MNIKQIAQNSFYQLLVIYAVIVILIAVGIFHKFSLQFHILAIILGIIGIAVLPDSVSTEKTKNKKLHYAILIIAIIFLTTARIIPYLDSQIPLGYDAGIYKYGIEHGLENKDFWILSGGMEPGFLYLMEIFKIFFSSQTILTWLFVAFNVLLGISIYLFTKEFISEEAALFSVVIFALSLVQFKTFSYMYYKNVVGLCFMLFALLFLKKYEKSSNKYFLAAFVILGGILLAIHRPTFYIFGLTYFFYTFIVPYKEKIYSTKKLKVYFLAGVLILAIGILFYLGDFLSALTAILPFVAEGFVSPGESPGTFISFFQYQYSTLFYLPIALVGLFYFIRKKQFNFVVIWAIINLATVYFQFFFFNRFIIHLDIALIILAGAGFTVLKQKGKWLQFVIALLLIAGAVMAIKESLNAEPLISRQTLNSIENLNKTLSSNAKLLVISSEYSPWIMGYSGLEGKNIIAPGLFDENSWSQEEWNRFWSTADAEETKQLMSAYSSENQEIYLFAGTKTFNNSCFTVYSDNGGKVYKYAC